MLTHVTKTVMTLWGLIYVAGVYAAPILDIYQDFIPNQVFNTPTRDSEWTSFGKSVDVSKNYAVASSRRGLSGDRSRGAAFIYRNINKTWFYQHELLVDELLPDLALQDGDYFGVDVAIDNNWVVVGAPGTGPLGTGAVYVFLNNGDGFFKFYQKIEPIDADGDGEGANYGSSVDIKGDQMIVGASAHNLSMGAVYIYKHDGHSWNLENKVVPEKDGKIDEFFGSSVAISGQSAVVGADSDDTHGINSGAAYTLQNINQTWQITEKITAGDVAAQHQDWFGRDVSIRGDMIAVGAAGVLEILDIFGARISGSVYIFKQDQNGDWLKTQRIQRHDPPNANPYDHFGFSVDLDGNKLAISSFGNDNVKVNGGASYVYQQLGDRFIFLKEFAPQDNLSDNDEFGYDVAISENNIMVGAPRTDELHDDPQNTFDHRRDVGRVYVLDLDLNVAVPLPLLDSDGDSASNLQEYASGTDPTVASSRALPASSNVKGYLTLEVVKNPAATDVLYSVEISTDLKTWDSAGTVVVSDDTNGMVVRSATLMADPADPAKQRGFMRATYTLVE